MRSPMFDIFTECPLGFVANWFTRIVRGAQREIQPALGGYFLCGG